MSSETASAGMAPSGSQSIPRIVTITLAVKIKLMSGSSSALLTKEISEIVPKYHATSGIVKSDAPREVETETAIPRTMRR